MTAHPNRNWKKRVGDQAEALGPGLLTAWENIHQDKTPTARAELLDVTLHNLAKYRRGAKPIPFRCIAYMQRQVLAELFGVHLGDQIADAINPDTARV